MSFVASEPSLGIATAPHCPVCEASRAERFLTVDDWDYWSCPLCEARFLDPRHHPVPEDELAHYLHHENDPSDPRYRRFLSKLADPLMHRLRARSQGLDYGCGPGPALAAILREAGHEIALYDPFFAADATPLERQYDFVTCTEAAEHFHCPAAEFDRLRRLVRPGGWLALMTCFQTDDARFARWHYRRDPTHVVFYREATFRYLADAWGWVCSIPVKDIVLMQRPMSKDST
jgi:SAM-dependent methyltransferase